MGHHQDGDKDYSWHCFSLKEEQLITIQEQDTTERILQHGGEAKPPPFSLETKKDCVRRVQEQLLVNCIAPPLG